MHRSKETINSIRQFMLSKQIAWCFCFLFFYPQFIFFILPNECQRNKLEIEILNTDQVLCVLCSTCTLINTGKLILELFFLSIFHSECLLLVVSVWLLNYILLCWEWWEYILFGKKTKIDLGMRKPKKNSFGVILLTLWFSHRICIKENFVFLIGKLCYFASRQLNFIKQIRLVCRTTVIFYCGFGSRLVLK